MLTSRRAFYLLFFLSGASALIYESVWARYLQLFLGHAAYAQALVLSIFMGGLALGAWSSNRLLGRWSNLLVVYAAIEAIIGVLGLVFHGLFSGFLHFSYHSALPALPDGPLIPLYQWLCATLLILPQCILLGMTFPLMTNGLLRQFPDLPGKTISLLYFSNSIGAAGGVLWAGFFLIDQVGLPGALLTAGIINILVAVGAWLISVRAQRLAPERRLHPWSAVRAASRQETETGTILKIVAGVAALTGLASFIYEIVWIRQLSLVFGASTHAFELMLSAFISGLAVGGLVIAHRADRISHPLRTTGWIQLVMALMAILTLPLYHYSFSVMDFFIRALEKNDAGYLLFHIVSHLIALAIMLPTTICAGMVLPLLTLHLARQHGLSERSIGIVYATNTMGTLVAVYFTVFWGLPKLTAAGSLFAGSGIDMLVGLALLYWLIGARRQLLPAGALAALVVALGISWLRPDLQRLSSGVFRYGLPEEDIPPEVLFYRDGSTLTTSVRRRHLTNGNQLLIMTNNGKPDASLGLHGHPSPDELIMFLAGTLPLMYQPDARHLSHIGLGGGLTTHTTLALSTTLETVDTVEIEPIVVDAARLFLPYNRLVYEDPRSRMYIEDARIFHARHRRPYDIIISMPSNPWANGAASLFTEEFYQHVRSHLEEDGIFTQWLQLYELTPELLATVINALARHFPYALFYSTSDNIIMLTSARPLLPVPPETAFPDHPSREFDTLLEKLGLEDLGDIWQYFVGTQDQLYPWAASLQQPVNSDYFPVLDLYAQRARFRQDFVWEITDLLTLWLPVFDWLYLGTTASYSLQGTDYLDPDLNPDNPPASDPTSRISHSNTMMSLLLDGNSTLATSRPLLLPLYQALNDDNCRSWPPERQILFQTQMIELLTETLRFAGPRRNSQLRTTLRGGCLADIFPRRLDWYEALLSADIAAIQHSAGQLLREEQLLETEKQRILESLFVAHFINGEYPAAQQTLRDYTTSGLTMPPWMDVLMRSTGLTGKEETGP